VAWASFAEAEARAWAAALARRDFALAAEVAELGALDVEGADVDGPDVEGADVDGPDVEGADVEGADVERLCAEGLDTAGLVAAGSGFFAGAASTLCCGAADVALAVGFAPAGPVLA
jgi:uncharacterized protein YjbI with pentapeptide repeats